MQAGLGMVKIPSGMHEIAVSPCRILRPFLYSFQRNSQILDTLSSEHQPKIQSNIKIRVRKSFDKMSSASWIYTVVNSVLTLYLAVLYTFSNARRFYSSFGDLLANKGLTDYLN